MKKAQAISCLTSWLAGWLVGDATLPGQVDHLRRFHCGSRTGRVPAPHSLPELLILRLAMASVLCRTALLPPSLGILSQLRQSKELIQSTQCSAEVEAPNIWSYRAVLGPRLRCVGVTFQLLPSKAINSPIMYLREQGMTVTQLEVLCPVSSEKLYNVLPQGTM